jgi:hypothetical protein
MRHGDHRRSPARGGHGPDEVAVYDTDGAKLYTMNRR